MFQVSYILGVIRSLKGQRTKICKIVYLSLLLTCSCKPTLFTNENIIAAVVSVLRRDVTSGVKGNNKTNAYFHILFMNLVTHAFADVGHWPDVFVKVRIFIQFLSKKKTTNKFVDLCRRCCRGQDFYR